MLGWRLNKRKRYEPLVPNNRGWLRSEELGLWIGTWMGKYQGKEATWLRFYDAEFRLVLTAAEAERERADTATAELARLKDLLARKGVLRESAEDAK